MVNLVLDNIDSDELKSLLHFLFTKYGYDFSGYAPSSMKRRSYHFMITRQIETLEQLRHLLSTQPKFFVEFVQTISVTVTEMFRDPAFYQSLRENTLPRLSTYPVIRIWIAGCATGEEVYSMAILLKEEGLLSRTVIYATDINLHSLEAAKEGIFPLAFMKNYTKNYQQSGGKGEFSSYYVAAHSYAMFNKSLRKNIVFSSHNLVSDGSFNEFQLILCRNVLIYFTPPLQNRVVNLFYDSLCPFGYLALGSKESLAFTEKKVSFEPVDKKQKIFRRVN